MSNGKVAGNMGLRGWPDWLHFREADGSITAKRAEECQGQDIERYLDQIDAETKAQQARWKLMEEMLERVSQGELPESAAEEYFARMKPLSDEYRLLWGADIEECQREEERHWDGK